MPEAPDDGFGSVTVTRVGITDEEIVELIRDRKLLLGINNIVLKWHESRLKYVSLKPIVHRGRNQHVIRLGDRYRKIGRNRLLWMLVKHETIPAGMDVDHEDRDRTNDHPSNLRLRDSYENQCDNVSKQQLENVMDYFERTKYACDVCGNVPDENGVLEHGRGCYVVSEDGGGTSFVDFGA